MNHQTFKTPRVRHGSSQVTMVVPWGSSPLHTVPSSSTGGKGTGATSMMTWLSTPPFEVKNMTLVLWWLGMILIYIYILYIVSWIHGRSCRGETRLYMQCAKYIYMIFVVNPLKIYLKCWCWHREISITLATLGHSLKKKSNFQRFIYHVKRWLDPQNPALWVPWILLCWTIIEVPSWLHTFRNLSAGYIVIHPQQYRGLVW